MQGVPIAYLTGKREFYGLELKVDNRVLDPRADTEILVQWALELAPYLPTNPCIADMGTGSGAIACALAQHLPKPHTIWASDYSEDALAVAKENAQRLQLAIQFTQGNWFDAWPDSKTKPKFNLIVTNPPYIALNDRHLEALHHEPMDALVSGKDGLDDIRTLITQAPQWLAPKAWLLVEHGYNQANNVRALFEQNQFSNIQARLDLANITRCTGGQWLN